MENIVKVVRNGWQKQRWKWKEKLNLKKHTDCMYCELTIHGGCLRGDCPCECKGDRNKFITEHLS